MALRLLDVFLSGAAIAVLLPFMLPVIVALRLTGEHHVFYGQPRVGKGGRDFTVLKFATMLEDSPNLPGGVLTQKDDPRILPMGKFLRRTKVNELPQLVNVLLGQMSLVGPRPQARRHYELYPSAVRQALDGVPPGLTGIGSIVFRDEESMLDRVPGDRDAFHDAVVAPYKGELEMWWVAHRGLGTYFILILMTAWTLVRPGSTPWRKVLRDLPEPPAELEAYL